MAFREKKKRITKRARFWGSTAISGNGEEAGKRTLRDDGSSTQMQLKHADRHEIRPTVFAFFSFFIVDYFVIALPCKYSQKPVHGRWTDAIETYVYRVHFGEEK